MIESNKWEKLNKEPIRIETVPDEHDESLDFEPSFWWNNRRYHLKNFIRTHNNPWVGGQWPEFIHAYEAEEYHNPLYIELIGDDAVNIYKEAEEFSYCEETVDIWMKEVGENIEEEIEEAKAAISNERLWLKGAADEEQQRSHLLNIANYQEFISRLKEACGGEELL